MFDVLATIPGHGEDTRMKTEVLEASRERKGLNVHLRKRQGGKGTGKRKGDGLQWEWPQGQAGEVPPLLPSRLLTGPSSGHHQAEASQAKPHPAITPALLWAFSGCCMCSSRGVSPGRKSQSTEPSRTNGWFQSSPGPQLPGRAFSAPWQSSLVCHPSPHLGVKS